MKYFITGCAGFIGSNLVDRLLAEGHTVTGYDNFSTGQEEFISAALRNPNLHLIRADVLDIPMHHIQPMHGVEFVSHIATSGG